jgi:hypothetical protein
MSNQYRKVEPPQPSREDRLFEARLVLASAAKLHKDDGAKVQSLLQADYSRRGGKDIDSQIEGMLLVVEEGKLYRRAALRYAAEMEKFAAGTIKVEPPRPDVAAVSPSTMVAASRQFEKLAARKQWLLEESELTIAAMLSETLAIARPRREAEPHPDALPQSGATPAQKQPEDKPATPGKRAATAAA